MAIKSVSIVFSLTFLFLAYLVKRVVGTWLNPGSIFSLFWLIYTIIPLILVVDAYVNPLSIVYILIFCCFFSVGSFIFPWRSAFKQNETKQRGKFIFSTSIFKISFYAIALITIFLMLLGMTFQGFSLSQMLDPMTMAGEFASKRYSSEIVANFYSQSGLQGAYVTIVLGGLYYGAIETKVNERLLVIFLSFLPSVIAMSLQSAKGLFFFSIFVFYAGVLINNIYNQKLVLLPKRVVAKIFLCVIIILPVLLASFLSRGLTEASFEESLIRLYSYLISYSSGHLYAFSDWFSERYFSFSSIAHKQEVLSGGFYTFMSVFQVFGYDKHVPMGIYNEFYNYEDLVVSNIYTVFRGLITDFTLPGSLIFSLFVGILVNFCFYRLLVEKMSSFYIMVFIFFVGMSYQSYIISSMTWITIPFVFVINFCILHILLVLQKKR